jgi:hypothetical protein
MNKTDIDVESLLEKTSRRRALKNLGLGALGATVGIGLGKVLAGTNYLPAGDSVDTDVLDFALNLEYLEANFYSYATTGQGIEARDVAITGRGKQGTVLVPSTTMVTFGNPDVAAYAAEITADEIAHVKFLREAFTASGRAPVAQPSIDLVNSFSAAASAAGLGSGFSPFANSANDLNFLLGAFIFEDVGVTAYHGAITSLQDKATLTAAAGIMGTEAYHASNVRTELYKIGNAAISAVQDISDARNSLGGEGLDQGIETNGTSSIVPSDSNALVFARTVRLVLNIVYLGVNATKGGFFPDGINA